MLMFIFVFALVAGLIGFFTHARRSAPGTGYGSGRGDDVGVGWSGGSPGRYERSGSRPAPYAVPYGAPHEADYQDVGGYGSPAYGSPEYDGPASPSMSAADAEAEARHWIDLLGAGLTQLDGAADQAAVQSLSEAAERDTSARRQLVEAQTARQYELAGRTAREGLHYIRAARLALGQDPGPQIGPEVAGVRGSRQVTIGGQDYMASGRPGDRTPYYYPGGLVQGRMVPSGWYSTPWWKTALVVGGAGLGSMVLMDALFGGLHHGGMGGGPFDGGMGGGGPFDGGMGGPFEGGMDGGGFGDGGPF